MVRHAHLSEFARRQLGWLSRERFLARQQRKHGAHDCDYLTCAGLQRAALDFRRAAQYFFILWLTALFWAADIARRLRLWPTPAFLAVEATRPPNTCKACLSASARLSMSLSSALIAVTTSVFANSFASRGMTECIRRKGIRQHLQGVVPLESCVVRSPDLAHAALANQGGDFVRADAATGADGHVRGILRHELRCEASRATVNAGQSQDGTSRRSE